MVKYEQVKQVIKKIASIPELQGHICFFGGAMPYVMANSESNREHSDIDVLVDEEYMEIIRNLINKYQLEASSDSLDLELDDDYGLKMYIDGVYVEFEPMSIQNNMFTRKSYSPNKELYGVESLPFKDISDIIIPINIDGITTYSQSPEFIKVSKEKHKRDKDMIDIEFIDKMGIDNDKYERIKMLYNNLVEETHSYERIK